MTEPMNALALAAGGARGAYQAGAMLYLAERGLRFPAVAGTSIGTLNAAFYVQGDGSPGHIGELCARWRQAPRHGLIRANSQAFAQIAAALVNLTARRNLVDIASVVGQLASGEMTLLDPRPVMRLLDDWLDYGRICQSSIRFTIAMLRGTNPLWDILSGPARAAEYLRAADLQPQELRMGLLAAIAVPFAFPAKDVCGIRGADAALADPLPARILYANGARRIFSIFLSDETPQNRLDFHDGILYQIRPSIRIDTGVFGAFDFSADRIDRLIELGYADAGARLVGVHEVQKAIATLCSQGEENQSLADHLPDRCRNP